jgi:putative peptide zinc metalloprotease protein
MDGLALPPRLPALREDLKLHRAGDERGGAPAWTVEDPVRGRFYRIGWIELELLARWALGTPQRLLEAVRRETTLDPRPEELSALLRFLGEHQLLRVTDAAALSARAARARPSWWRLILHRYLFFRVPVWRPQRWLTRALPRVAWVLSPGFAWVAAALGAIGLLLAARQWDVFLASFRDSLGFEGLLGYAFALAGAKLLHEMGHALAATRHGVQVAHMGIAFVLMFPLLYTDTGQSWKLSDRRKRIAIAAAGLRMEFALAALATAAWSLVPEGSLRGALFFLATTSWLVSLGINASPFMRFDGYFLLSDALDLPNLHERAGAAARAWVRRVLLGWREAGEPLPRGLRRFLIGFALVTWAYRFAVFLAIALLVYHFFFKALGVALFAIEVWWLIARPVWAELRVWWQRRRETRLGGALRMTVLSMLLIVIGLLPWQSRIFAPALLHAQRQHVVYTPVSAQLVEAVPREGPVAAGALLFALDSHELRLRAQQARIAAAALQREVAVAPLAEGARDDQLRLASQLAQRLTELEAQQAELNRLELRAPFAGVVRDVDPLLGSGALVSSSQPLAVLVDPSSWVVEALIAQQDVARVPRDAPARFFPAHDPAKVLHGQVIAIDSTRVTELPDAMLALAHGGPLPTTSADNLKPRAALYRVRIALSAPPPAFAEQRGEVVIEGARRSLFARGTQWAAALFIRESGF